MWFCTSTLWLALAAALLPLPTQASTLSARLVSKDSATREEALRDVAGSNDAQKTKLAAELIPALDSDDMYIRAWAARAFVEIGAPGVAAAPELARHQLDSFQIVIDDSCKALGTMGAGAVPALLRMLDTNGTERTIEAVEGLGCLGPAAANGVPKLLAYIQARKVGFAPACALGRALARVGAASFAGLRDLSKSPLASARMAAVCGLAKLPDQPARYRVLTKALDDDDAAVARTAAISIGEMGPPTAGALPAIRRMARSNDPERRQAATYALSRLAPAEAIPIIRADLHSQDARSRRSAATMMLTMAAADTERRTIATLALDALADRDESVRYAAVDALLQVRETIPEAVLPLARDLQLEVAAGSAPTREAPFRPSHLANAMSLLGRYGPQASPASPTLEAMLHSTDPSVRMGAARALEEIDPAAAMPFWLEQLSSTETAVRLDANDAVTKFRTTSRKGLDLALSWLRDKNPEIQAIGARTIAACERERNSPTKGRSGPAPECTDDDAAAAVPVVVSLLEKKGVLPAPLPSFREMGWVDASKPSLQWLVDMGPQARAALPLAKRLISDPSPQLRASAARVLGAMGPGVPQVLTLLTVAVDDRDARVRQEAAESLVAALRLDYSPLRQVMRRVGGRGRESIMRALADSLSESHRRGFPPRAIVKVDPVVSELISLGMKDAVAGVRTEAFEAAAGVQGLTDAAGDALHDPDPHVRLKAALDMGPRYYTSAVLPELISGLALRDDPYRIAALVAISQFGIAARPAIPSLAAVISDTPSWSQALPHHQGDPSARRSGDPERVVDEERWKNAGVAALLALRAMGVAAHATLPRVLTLAHDPDPEVRAAAALCSASVALRASEALPTIQTLMADREELVRTAALEAMGNLSPAKARATVTAKGFIAGAPQQQLIAAVSVLAPYAADDPIAQRLLGDLAQDADPSVQATALKVMRFPAARPSLLAALHRPQPSVRIEALRSLRAVGFDDGETKAALAELLADKVGDVRSLAAEAIGDLGANGADLVPALATALKQNESRAQIKAFTSSDGGSWDRTFIVDPFWAMAIALGKMGPAAHGAIPALAGAFAARGDEMSHPCLSFSTGKMPQSEGCISLGRGAYALSVIISTIGVGHVSAVEEMLADGSSPVRVGTIKALSLMGPRAAAAMPALIVSAHHADAATRAAAVAAAAAIEPDSARTRRLLLVGLADSDSTAAVAAADAAAALGPHARMALPVLTTRLADADPAVALHAACALTSVDPRRPQALPRLEKAVRSADRAESMMGVRCLAPMGAAARAAVPAVVEALREKDRLDTSMATRTLLSISTRAALEYALPLAVRFMQAPDRRNQLTGLEIADGLGEKAKGATPALVALAESGGSIGSYAASLACKLDTKTAPDLLLPRTMESLSDPEKAVGAAYTMLRAGMEATSIVSAMFGKKAAVFDLADWGWLNLLGRKSFTEALVTAIPKMDADHRAMAAEVLARDPKGIDEALYARLLKDDSDSVQITACAALQSLHSETANRLVSAFRNPT